MQTEPASADFTSKNGCPVAKFQEGPYLWLLLTSKMGCTICSLGDYELVSPSLSASAT